MKVETGTGIYNIRKPAGRIGAVHFGILSKMAPTSPGEKDAEGNAIVSQADNERTQDAFIEWSVKVLPNIIIDGPHKYNDMPGSDQFALFAATMEGMEGDTLGGELFRIIE